MAETGKEKKGAVVGLWALAAVALVLGATSLGIVAMAPKAPSPAPVDRQIRLIISSVEPHNASMMMGEMHVFTPDTIVVNLGDRVTLTIVNMDEHRHGFELRDFNVRTDSTLDIAPGDSATVTFVADKRGVFRWVCNVPFAPAAPAAWMQDCGDDHQEMGGYLIVQ